LTNPQGLATDPATHNLYIADTGNNVIERDAGGHLSIVAGTGAQGSPMAGPATSSPLRGPYGVAVDAAGEMLIADSGNSEIERVSAAGALSVVGHARSWGIAFAPASAVFFSDGSRFVKRMTAAGAVTTIAGNVYEGVPTFGSARASAFVPPLDIGVDATGNVYVPTDSAVVYKVSSAGVLSRFAGTGADGSIVPGPARNTPLGANAAAVGPGGNVYMTDTAAGDIVRVTPSGTLSIFTHAVPQPWGLTVDHAGNVFTFSTATLKIYKVTPSGQVTVVAGNGGSGRPAPGPALSTPTGYPYGLAVDSHDNLYWAPSYTTNRTVVKVTPAGALSIIANLPVGTGDGWVDGVAVDGSGDVFLADAATAKIEMVTPAGVLLVVAGNGAFAIPRPGAALLSGMNPDAIAMGPAGSIYVGDENAVVEKLTPVLPAITTRGHVTISGIYTVGHTLHVVLPTFSPSRVTVSYQWYGNGHAIRGAHYSYLRLTSTLRHQVISVRVTASKSGYRSYSVLVVGKRVS